MASHIPIPPPTDEDQLQWCVQYRYRMESRIKGPDRLLIRAAITQWYVGHTSLYKTSPLLKFGDQLRI